MLTLTFLVKTVVDLYVMVLLLRIWMQWTRADFYNPFAQFVVKITQPMVGPLRRIIPSLGPNRQRLAAVGILADDHQVPAAVAHSRRRNVTQPI